MKTCWGYYKTRERIWTSLSIPSTIKDRLGGGDAFTAGVLHGTIMNWETQKILDFATAAFATTKPSKVTSII